MHDTSRSLIRVLIVDDHTLVAEGLARLLAVDPTIEVVGKAATAAAGLAMALRTGPDVVVMDFVLPDMDGATATRMLRLQMPGVKVIMVTGLERKHAHLSAMEAGCVACLSKTGQPSVLRDAVRRAYAGDDIAGPPSDAPRLDQLTAHYQPIVELATRRVVGLEAVVRWQHPARGLLYPATFLDGAEETGDIHKLSRWVAHRAVDELKRWQAAFPREPHLWVSVNLSASALSQPDTVDWVAKLVRAAGIAPADLVLEITETVLLEETPATLDRLNALRALGVRVALDDFGSAFSSLSYLRRFPFDLIKIDTEFTAELPGAPRSVLLVESIRALADSVGLAAVAEGIERPEQAQCLIDAGWEYGQGFLYSRPVPAEAVDGLLALEAL